jgi:DNA-binding MarR family transcriptional regulator
MQLLRPANHSPASGSGTEDSSEQCARCVMDVAPPVVRVLRTLMRCNRLEGLSVPQFRAMAMLKRTPKASLSAVADHVGSSLPAASRMIEGLVARKLVIRHECRDDRRQISLSLTPRGASAFTSSRKATHRELTGVLAVLTPAQRRTVVDAMNILAEVVGSDAVHVLETVKTSRRS